MLGDKSVNLSISIKYFSVNYQLRSSTFKTDLKSIILRFAIFIKPISQSIKNNPFTVESALSFLKLFNLACLAVDSLNVFKIIFLCTHPFFASLLFAPGYRKMKEVFCIKRAINTTI